MNEQIQPWHVGKHPANHLECIAGILGFVLVDALDVSAPLVVLLGAVLGLVGWATNMH